MTLSALALVGGCSRPTCGSEDLVFDETANVCICRPGLVERDGACTPADAGLDRDGSVDGAIDAGAEIGDDAGTCAWCECQPGETRRCADGSDVGECDPGEQVCGTGGTWGTCVGLRAPDDEVCDGRDQDCDGRVDEELTSVGSPMIVDTFTSPGWEYETLPLMAVRGANAETIGIWIGLQSQTGGEYESAFAQRISAAGEPIGERVVLVSPSEITWRLTAYSTDTDLIVITAAQEDPFSPTQIGVGRYSLFDLERIEARTVRRLSGTMFPAEIAASQLDPTRGVVAMRMTSGQTYVFVAPVDPLPTTPATGAIPEPVTIDGGDVELWYDRATTSPWIAYTDGANVRVARINPDGEIGTSVVVENAEQPVLRGSAGRLGLAYLDPEGNARFASFTPADPPIRGAGLDLGPVWAAAGRRTLTMVGYDTREQWLASMVRVYGSLHRVTLHGIVPSGTGFAADEVEITPAMTAFGGLAASRSSERSVLTVAGGSTLRAISYGCP